MKEFYAANQEQGEEGLADQVIVLNWGLILVLAVWIAALVVVAALVAIVVVQVVWIAVLPVVAAALIVTVVVLVVVAPLVEGLAVVLVVAMEAPERALVLVSGQHFLVRERT
jgi:hypothetical protein